MYDFPVYIISLPAAKNRLDKVFLTLPKTFSGKNIHIFDAVDGSKVEIPSWWKTNAGRYGCHASHMSILETIVEKDLKNVLILEDDVHFTNNFDEIFSQSFPLLPPDWDQFYLGGSHQYNPTLINNYVYKADGLLATHAYMIKDKQSAKKILSYFPDVYINHMYLNSDYQIDQAYAYLHIKSLINVYTPNIFIVGQFPDNVSYCDNFEGGLKTLKLFNRINNK